MARFIEVYCDTPTNTLIVDLFAAGSGTLVYDDLVCTAIAGKPGYFLSTNVAAGTYDVVLADGMGADQVIVGAADNSIYQCLGHSAAGLATTAQLANLQSVLGIGLDVVGAKVDTVLATGGAGPWGDATSVQAIPAIGRSELPPPWNQIVLYLDSPNVIVHTLYQADGATLLSLAGVDPVLCIAKHRGATVAEIIPPALQVTGSTLTWSAPALVTAREDLYSWSLRDRSKGNAHVAGGDLSVQYSAKRL